MKRQYTSAQTLPLLCMALLFSWYMVLAWQIPLMADDLCLIPTSFADAIATTIKNYHQWTGRWFPIGLITILNLFPEWLTDIAIGIALLATVRLLALVGWGTAPPLAAWLAACALFLLTAPAVGEILWWQSGAANYLFPLVADLIFILPFAAWLRNEADPFASKTRTIKGALILGWLLAAFIGPGSNENTGPALIGVAGLIILFGLFKGKRMPWMLCFGIMLAITGAAVLILAPGNAGRLNDPVIASHIPLPLPWRVFALVMQTRINIPWFLPLLATIGAVLLWLPFTKRGLDANGHIALALWLGGAAAWAALIFTPYVEPRALTGALTMLTLAILCLWRHLSQPKALLATLPHTWVAVTAGSLALVFGGYVYGLYQVPLAVTAIQNQQIESCKLLQGAVDCPVMRHLTRRNFTEVLSNFRQPEAATTNWSNGCWAKHEKVGRIIGINPY